MAYYGSFFWSEAIFSREKFAGIRLSVDPKQTVNVFIVYALLTLNSLIPLARVNSIFFSTQDPFCFQRTLTSSPTSAVKTSQLPWWKTHNCLHITCQIYIHSNCLIYVNCLLQPFEFSIACFNMVSLVVSSLILRLAAPSTLIGMKLTSIQTRHQPALHPKKTTASHTYCWANKEPSATKKKNSQVWKGDVLFVETVTKFRPHTKLKIAKQRRSRAKLAGQQYKCTDSLTGVLLSLPWKKFGRTFFSKNQFLLVLTLSHKIFGLSLDHLAARFYSQKTQDCDKVLGAKTPKKNG